MKGNRGRPRKWNNQTIPLTGYAKAETLLRRRTLGQDARNDVGVLEYVSEMNFASRAVFMRWRYALSERFKADYPLHFRGLSPAAIYERHLYLLGAMDIAARSGKSSQFVRQTHSANTYRINRVIQGVREPIIPIPEERQRDQLGWKKEVDCELFYSPRYGHTHGIKKVHDVTVQDLLDPKYKFFNFLNMLDDVVRTYLADTGQESLHVEDVPLESLYQLDFRKWDDNHDKLQRYFSSPKSSSNVPSVFYPASLLSLYIERRETFYDVMTKFAVVAHKVMEWLVRRMQQATYTSYHEISKHERKFRVYLWPLLWEKITAVPRLTREQEDRTREKDRQHKLVTGENQRSDPFTVEPFCKLEIHHLTFFAQFHPYYVPPGNVRRCDDFRVLLTDDELLDLCSVCDETERFRDIKFKVREKRVFDPIAKRVTREKVDPNQSIRRGYFIGREGSRLAAGRVGPDVEPFIQWLRQTYEADLTRKDGKEEKKVVFLETREKLDRVDRDTRDLQSWGALKTIMREFESLVGNPDDWGDVTALSKWLSDPQAPNKSQDSNGSIPIGEFVNFDHDRIYYICQDYCGARATAYIVKNAWELDAADGDQVHRSENHGSEA